MLYLVKIFYAFIIPPGGIISLLILFFEHTTARTYFHSYPSIMMTKYVNIYKRKIKEFNNSGGFIWIAMD